MFVDNFAEEYLGIKLKPYQKLILKAMEKKDGISYYINPRRVYKRNLMEYQIEMAKALKMNFIVRRRGITEYCENGKLVKFDLYKGDGYCEK